MLKFLKSSWSAIVVFIFGFFLIKRGIDKQALQHLAIEKAKEDAVKNEFKVKEQVEKAEVEQKYSEESARLQYQIETRKQEIKQEIKNLENEINNELKTNPDKFAEQFANKFNINYDKGKN